MYYLCLYVHLFWKNSTCNIINVYCNLFRPKAVMPRPNLSCVLSTTVRHLNSHKDSPTKPLAFWKTMRQVQAKKCAKVQKL